MIPTFAHKIKLVNYFWVLLANFVCGGACEQD